MGDSSESGEEQEQQQVACTANSWMECSIYQNYTASEVLVQGLAGVVNQGDVELVIRAQKKMLQRFEKTNEMLTNVNSLAGQRLERASGDFKKHSACLSELKRDLESVFKRIRAIKAKMAKQMPEAYSLATEQGGGGAVGEEDDEYDVAIRERKAKEELPQSGERG